MDHRRDHQKPRPIHESAAACRLHQHPPVARGAEQTRILIVDDEEALVWSLSTRLSKVRPGYVVVTASNGVEALEKLREQPLDLLVADVRMPGMSGIDLVFAALQHQPNLPVVVMTAFKTAEVSTLAEISAIQFLEKPFDFDFFLTMVDHAAGRGRRGFSGAISVQTLPDIVQLYVLSSATGALSVRHRGDEGRIWFKHGGIPHATTPTREGDDAVYEILMWTGGEFSMQLGATAPTQSVQADWQELLMESCRRLDERERQGGGPPSVATGWTISPPPSLDADPFEGLQLEWTPSAASQHPLSQPALQPPLLPTDVSITSHLAQPHASKEKTMNIKDSLTQLTSIDGFVGAALVDSESGMLLGQEGGGPVNLEIAAAGNTEVVRAKRKTMANLGLKDGLEDMLITLSKQYHLIRPLRARPGIFYYLVLDRQRANLAMARLSLADVEKDLQV